MVNIHWYPHLSIQIHPHDSSADSSIYGSPQSPKEEPSRAARRMAATEKLFGGGRSSTGWDVDDVRCCSVAALRYVAEVFFFPWPGGWRIQTIWDDLRWLMWRFPDSDWRWHIVAPVSWTVHGPYPVRMQLCVTASRLNGCKEKVCWLQSSSGLDISFRMLFVSYDVPYIIIWYYI